MELTCAVNRRHRSLTIQIKKVHSVRALAIVAGELSEDADWLADIPIDLEPEDGLISAHDPKHPNGAMAFSEVAIESPCNLIKVQHSMTK